MQEAPSGGALLRPQASPWAARVSMRGCVCRCVGGGEDSQQSRFNPPVSQIASLSRLHLDWLYHDAE